MRFSVVVGSLLLASAVGCASPGRPPYTSAETERALAPTRDLRARCYAGTDLERAGRAALLDYDIGVQADGSVRSVPVRVDPEKPELVECVRHRLDELKFPPRGRDRLSLHFELLPTAPAPTIRSSHERPGTEEQLGTCEPPCAEGFSCHYEPKHAAQGVCRVSTGRCRFDRDCPPSQACQRLSERLGVCSERP
ncbi:MAG TPA: hypothetical protein VEQ58_14380 [Polyangiaceae bacterium]|nr:hypothetical protein [Polyangiaceae bacterium]